jgi:hypothetical protein
VSDRSVLAIVSTVNLLRKCFNVSFLVLLDLWQNSACPMVQLVNYDPELPHITYC